MATISNTLAKAVTFDKAKHATTSEKARPIVASAPGGFAALRLIGSPDVAQWVKGGVEAVTRKD